MRWGIKFTAMLVLVLVAWGLAVGGSPTASKIHPAGCPLHREFPSPPTPAGDHSCCRSGQEVAVVEKAAVPDQDLAGSPLLCSERDPVSLHLSTDSLSGLPAANTPPPGNLPMRI